MKATAYLLVVLDRSVTTRWSHRPLDTFIRRVWAWIRTWGYWIRARVRHLLCNGEELYAQRAGTWEGGSQGVESKPSHSWCYFMQSWSRVVSEWPQCNHTRSPGVLISSLRPWGCEAVTEKVKLNGKLHAMKTYIIIIAARCRSMCDSTHCKSTH